MADKKVLVNLSLLTHNELSILIMFLARDNSKELALFRRNLIIEKTRRDNNG